MKRDMELIRKILLACESTESGYAPQPLEIDGYTPRQIGYHALILDEAGLVEGNDITSSSSQGPAGMITRLTWEGHEFLDAARESSRWEKAVAMVKKAGGATMPVWIALLTDIGKKAVGLVPEE